MALASSRVLLVRASWDTQERLPYNPNFISSRKLKKSRNKRSSRLKIDVDNLLKLDPKTPQNVSLEGQAYLGYERWLPSPPKVEKPRSSHNAASLAFIGDCIYELYARRHFLTPALNIEDYNDSVMEVVRCEAQDALLQKLSNADFLSEEERDVLRWGRNTPSSKNRSTKRAGVAVYSRASSLETLIGYLYLTNPLRLEDMMSWLGFSVGFSNQSILESVTVELSSLNQKTEKRPREKKPLLSRSKTVPSSVNTKEALVALIENGLDGVETSTVFS